jgi:hypothetical protein
MGVVPFQSAQAHAGAAALSAEAEKLARHGGTEVGWLLGAAARRPGVPEDDRRRMLALVDELEQVQGFRWVFGDEEGIA